MNTTRRIPVRRDGFCWARIPQDTGGVLYRLYRRDMRRAVHAVLRHFPTGCDRRVIAENLNRARHALRDQVDEIDLALMGVENA